MNEYRRIFKILLLMTGVWVLDPIINYLGKMAGIEFLAINIILQPGLIIVWGMYFRYRFAGTGRMKFCTNASLLLLFFWMICRQIRFDCFWIAIKYNYFMWYLYYVCALLIPLMSLITALFINRDEAWKLPVWAKMLLAITVILCILMVTNNLHQLAFRFEEGFTALNPHYTHGIVYYIMTVWQYLLYIVTMIVLIVKSRLSHERHLAWISVLPFIIGGMYLVRIVLLGEVRIGGFIFMGYPDTCCLMVALFLESCLQIGLLPSNESFGNMMQFSAFPAWIADKKGNIVYSVAEAGELTREQLTTPGDTMPDPDSILHCAQIPGGFACWRQDISQENAIHHELQEVLHQLEEEEVLIRLENNLKEEQEKLSARKQVYDAIARKAAGQFEKISTLAEEAEQYPDLYGKHSAAICVLSSFVKRCANLMLLIEDAKGGRLSAAELGYAIQESLHYLQKTGVRTIPVSCKDEMYSGSVLLDLYFAFEEVVEKILLKPEGISVFCSFAVLTEEEIMLRMVVEGADSVLEREIHSLSYEKIHSLSYATEKEDDILYITFTGKAGEA